MPSPEKPRPNVILMDVQMPILDGYRATKAIRTEEPYKSALHLGRVPIVAMTASAIQGDKEKCKRAGMDDYLAKPVKPKLLEKMLVKWALEARKGRGAPTSVSGSPMQQRTAVLLREDSKSPQDDSSAQSSDMEKAPPPRRDHRDYARITRHLSDRLQSIDFANQSALSRSAGTENDRETRRAQAEEKASSLRDDKLLNMGDDPRKQQHPGVSERQKGEVRGLDGKSSQRLTRENMELFEGRQEEERGRETADSSMQVRSRSTEGADRLVDGKASRPSLEMARMYKSDSHEKRFFRRKR